MKLLHWSAVAVVAVVTACGPDGAGGTETRPTGLTGPELALPSGLPDTIATVTGRPRGMVADATHVFWIDEDSEEIFAVTRAGGEEPVSLGVASEFSTDLRLDGTHLYWGAAGAIRRIAKTGGEVADVSTLGTVDEGLQFAVDLQLFDGQAYWTAIQSQSGVGVLARAPVGGGTPEVLFESDSPGGFAVGSGQVYFVDDDEEVLFARPLAGGEVRVVQAAFEDYASLWLEVDRFFMMRPSPINPSFEHTVNSMPAGGGTLRFEANLEGATSLLHDTTYFYWLDRFSQELKAQRRDQTTARTVLEIDETPWGVAVDEAGLVFFDGNELKSLGR